MTANINELRNQIAEKNLILNSLNCDKRKNKEKIVGAKKELDKLLYTYYKSLKCACNNVRVCLPTF